MSRGALAAALALALLSAPAARADEPASAPPLEVFAAASLAESFARIGAAFAAAQGGPAPVFNFAASSALVTQVEQGAPADVIATADTVTLARLERAGLLDGAPEVFARNRLAIVVERGNPKGVARLADLARPELIVVLAAEPVPAGRYARLALARAGVRVAPRSLEESVRGVVAKVALGEADAGIAYATDVRAAGARIEGIALPDAENELAAYPAAVLRAARDPDGARAFAAFLRAERAQAILAEQGFAPP